MALHYRKPVGSAPRVVYCARFGRFHQPLDGRTSIRIGALLGDPADLTRDIVDLLADRQAEDVVLLDIRRVTSFADYFVIATAMNARHMRALVEQLQKELPPRGAGGHLEGATDSGWVLLDYGDLIVHLFSADMRAHYALEELWSAATPVVRIQ